MLVRLARGVVVRRRLVLVLSVVFLALAGGIGGGVAQELSGGGFDDPKAESERASRLLETQFHTGNANFLLLLTSPGSVEDPDVARAGQAIALELAREKGVTEVRSYWSLGRPESLRSRDGHAALVMARTTGTQDEQVDRAAELATHYRGEHGGLTVGVGGMNEVYNEVGTTIEHDVILAESIAFPITAVLLILVFGSAIAAGLPLLIGFLSILGTFVSLHLLVQVTDVSVYSINLATAMGLGLGIDYSLFMVTRYREELRRGRGEHNAVLETVRTAGRTVLFSSLTALLSLSALIVFPLYFLKSFAYAGISAVFFAAIGALVVLPAALAGLGHRVDSLDLRRPLRRLLRMSPPRAKEIDEGLWHRVAMAVMRRPLPIATAVVALLLVAGAPFLQATFSLPDDRVLPKDAPAAQMHHTLRQDFVGRDALALSLVAPHFADVTRHEDQVSSYAAALSRVDGVERVDALTGTFVDGRQVAPATLQSARFASTSGTFLSAVPAVESFGPAGEDLVRALRAVPSPLGEVLVTGAAASVVDTKGSLGDRMPLALGLIVGATFVLLFLFTGSIVVPIKALVLNVLSLSATFGAMVWVFQQGHLTEYLGNPTITGTLDTTVPILMFCTLFGLSMDYEVFLLSRIKEEYDATGDNRRAVAVGLERTGRLVSAAAGLLAIVFLAFVSSDISFIKLLGLGTALAVLVDATLVRGALVPAFMRLMGRANWWAPRPLRRLHDRIGIREEPVGTELLLPGQRVAPETAGV